MGKEKEETMHPAQTVEARENQLISLAVDLAQKRLLDGTASSQVVTHFLKLGSTKERLEKEMMVEKKKLLKSKTEAIEAQKRVEELYAEALNAMKIYSGREEFDDD